jgi:hypothetical protein
MTAPTHRAASASFAAAPSVAAATATDPVTSVNGRTGAVTGLEETANKNAPNGYAGLDAGGRLPASQLPTGLTIDVSGALGVGETNPKSQLTVKGAGQATTAPVTSGALAGTLEIGDTGAAPGNGGMLLFSAGDGNWKFGAIKGFVTNGAGNSQGDIAFSGRVNATDGALTELMRLSSAGGLNLTRQDQGFTKGGYSVTPWLNVKTDYGAKGDGSTDDAAAINSAIAAANRSGGSIYFPPGIYKIASPLNSVTANGVRVRGDGRNATIIAAAFASGNTLTLNSQFSSVEDMSFSPSVFRTSGYEVYLTGGFNNVIRDVYVNGGYRGVAVISTATPFLENISLRYLTGDVGIYFSGTSSVSSYGMFVKNVVADNPYPIPVFNANLKSWGNSTAYNAGDVFIVNNWIWQAQVAGTSQSSGSPAAPSNANWNSSNVASGTTQLRAIANAGLTWLYMDSWSNSLSGANLALIGGWRGFAMADGANAAGSYPSWAYFFDLEIDHAYAAGADMEAGLGFHCVGGWFGSTFVGNGIQFGGSWKGEASISSSRIVANGQHGILLNAGVDMKIQGNIVANNSVNSVGAYHGVTVAVGISRFTITNNTTGVVTPFTSTNQAWGVLVSSGLSDHYVVQGNIGYGNLSGSVADGGAGAHKSVSGNV